MRSVLEMDNQAVETVQKSATVARVLSYVKDNRTEMIALLILSHLLGLTDRLTGHLSGVCM